VSKSLVLTEGNKEFLLQLIIDLGIVQDQSFQRTRNLDKLVNGLSCISLIQKVITEVNIGDLGAKSQIVQNSISTFTDRGILGHFNDLELLGSHQAISDLLTFLLIKIAISKVNFLDGFEVREDTANGLCILEGDGLIVQLKNPQLGQALQASI